MGWIKLPALLLAVLMVGSCNVVEPFDSIDFLQETFDSMTEPYVEIDGVQTLVQPTATTCGITAVTICRNRLSAISKTVAQAISDNHIDVGAAATPELIVSWLEQELLDQVIEYHCAEDPATRP